MNIKLLTSAPKKLALLLLYYSVIRKKECGKGLKILTYHRISDKQDLDDPLKVSLESFEGQMRYLEENFHILSGDELTRIIRKGRGFPEKSCLITFDDGWSDNYTNAFPVLKKRGIPALIFVTTDFIGKNRVFWHERLRQTLLRSSGESAGRFIGEGVRPEAARKQIKSILMKARSGRAAAINRLVEALKPFDATELETLAENLEKELGVNTEKDGHLMLSWEQIREMSSGGVTFGSHTKSHAILTQIDRVSVVEELRASKQIIERETKKPAHYLAYPNGTFDSEIAGVAKDLGYLAGFTCVPGINSFCNEVFVLRRNHVNEEMNLGLSGCFSEELFKVELTGLRTTLRNLLNKN